MKAPGLGQIAAPVAVTVVLSTAGACVDTDRPSETTQPKSAPARPGTPEREAPPARRTPPVPPAAAERREERERMVEEQIARPRDGREPVRSPAVIEAMRTVPRHAFVPADAADEAYKDWPLPIGHGQTISQPYIVAWMTELLEIGPDSKVLEIGTGSGYQAAVLAHVTPHVFTVEIVEPLAKRAKETLVAQGYTEIACRHGDGYAGWKEHAPFDGIIVTCAPDRVPEPLWDQLAPGGRIVIPVGERSGVQDLVVVTKTADGKRRSRQVSLVRFVPLTRDPSLKAKTLETPPPKQPDGKP